MLLGEDALGSGGTGAENKSADTLLFSFMIQGCAFD